MQPANLFNSLLLSLAALSQASAQFSDPPPMKWGEVTQEELRTSSFPADSNASAVILCDYGESEFNNRFQIVYTRHRRIKILTPEGYRWGTHGFTLFTHDATQRMEFLEGTTFSIRPDGSISEVELESDGIFKERIDGRRTRVKFTLPALLPGCIIEYRYRVVSNGFGYLADWVFQATEPTLWSEYRFQIPDVLTYASISEGYETYAVREEKSYAASYQTFGSDYTGASRNYDFNVEATAFRLAMKDLPAIRNEAHITSPSDYHARVSFQLSLINIPGRSPVHVLNTWEKLARDVMELQDFGGRLNEGRDIREGMPVLREGASATEKLKTVFNHIQQTITWNGVYDLFAGRALEEILRDKTGSSADIGLLLTTMLRNAGIDAYPVLVSTRSNGKIQESYPMLSEFDHVITYAEADGREYLLDATGPDWPAGMLPREALNSPGLLLVEGTAEWIPIHPDREYSSKSFANVALNPDGTIVGTLSASDAGYSGLAKRRMLKGKTDEEFVKDRFDIESLGFAVDSFSVVNNSRVDLPLNTEVQVSSAGYATKAGKLIYLNPIIVDRSVENPFKTTSRKFPADFVYGTRQTYTLNLKLPRGYSVKEFPSAIILRLPNEAGVYSRTSESADGRFTLNSRFEMNKTTFTPEEYSLLREFYVRLISLEAEQLVLEEEKGR